MEVERYLINLDSDIVSTLRERLRKFIRELQYVTNTVKILISYEYPFVKLSSSKRDVDQNSELDKYESRLTKKD